MGAQRVEPNAGNKVADSSIVLVLANRRSSSRATALRSLRPSKKHWLIASFDDGKSWQRLDDPRSQGYCLLIRTRRDGLLSLDPNAESARHEWRQRLPVGDLVNLASSGALR
jgi:hypothetical protein